MASKARHRRDDNGQIADHLDDPELDQRLRTYIEGEKARTKAGLIMMIDALDHYPVFAQAPELLERNAHALP